LSLSSGSSDSENKDLPAPGLPDAVFLPFWDDLCFITAIGNGVFYEVYSSTLGGLEVTFGWIGHSTQGPGTYHFAATFHERFLSCLKFMYYTIEDKRASATIGIQRLRDVDVYYAPKWSFNMPDAVPDGSTLTLDMGFSSAFTLGTFDNTACGTRELPP
jgi:hypothetical protein